MATKKNYAVGTEIEAYCTKCKMDREHVIETLKSDGNINRVVCHTCNGSHLFRLPKSKKKAPRVTRSRKGVFVATEEDLTKAKPYKMTGAFEAGDIIAHKTFGPGKVLEVRPGGKMQVGFAEGGKLLVCA